MKEMINIDLSQCDGISEMLISNDKQVVELALSILINRDKTNKESEKNFKIICEKTALGLFNKHNNSSYQDPVYVIKMYGKIVYPMGYGKKWNWATKKSAITNAKHFIQGILVGQSNWFPNTIFNQTMNEIISCSDILGILIKNEIISIELVQLQ